MNVMIFAAGKGTRLKPLTDIIPKALVPVEDKPLLQRVLERVTTPVNTPIINHSNTPVHNPANTPVDTPVDSGMSAVSKPTVVINIHHHAEQIRNFINTTRAHWYADIQLSDESDKLLETGGGLRKAAHLFRNDSPILIHNVDILSNVDLHAFYSQAKGEATLLVSSRKTSRYLLFDDNMRLVGWTNILTGEIKSPFPEILALADEVKSFNGIPHPSLREGLVRLYAFSGIHIITPQLIAVMDSWPEVFPIMDFYLSVCKDHDIRGILKEDLRLLDVGKLDTLESASSFLATL